MSVGRACHMACQRTWRSAIKKISRPVIDQRSFRVNERFDRGLNADTWRRMSNELCCLAMRAYQKGYETAPRVSEYRTRGTPLLWLSPTRFEANQQKCLMVSASISYRLRGSCAEILTYLWCIKRTDCEMNSNLTISGMRT